MSFPRNSIKFVQLVLLLTTLVIQVSKCLQIADGRSPILGSNKRSGSANHNNTDFSLTRNSSSLPTDKWTAIPTNISANKFVRIQVTAIHVDKAEFPLSRLLFKLTLKLALEAATRQLEQQQQQQQQLHQNQASTRYKVKLAMSIRSANTCSRQFASAVAAEEYYTKRARLFIVSGCDEAIRGVARLATVWRVPVMTAAGFQADLNDKKVFKSLVRVAFSLRAAVEFLFKIMRSFQWRRINLIVDESDPNSVALKGSIEKQLDDLQKTSTTTNTMTASRALAGNNYNENNSANESYAPSIQFNKISFDLQSLIHQQASATKLTRTNESSSMGQQQVASADKWPNEATERSIRDALKQSSMFSRVNILLIPQTYLRKFMLSAYDQNMANGMYTFINMPLLLAANDDQLVDSGAAGTAATANHSSQQAKQQTSNSFATGDNEFVWRSLGSPRNSHAKQAFESLMSIYLRTPTSKAYLYFVSKLADLANSDYATTSAAPTKWSPPSTDSTDLSLWSRRARVQLSVNPYSAAFYDCLMIYSIALADGLNSLQKQQQIRVNSSGFNLEELHANMSIFMRNRKFENMLTGTVAINGNGDRDTDYTLEDMNQMTGKYLPVFVYRADTRDIERVARIHWSSDPSVGPTTDTVECSLSGLCAGKPRSKFVIAISLAGAPLVVVLGSLFYFVHSRLSLESKLVDYWWKIHMSDLELVMTRRKNANDGSLVMDGAQAALSAAGCSGTNSLVSSSHVAGGGQLKMGPRVPSTAACDKTTAITKNSTEFNSTCLASSMDVCYGNITLAVYKLAKVALKPISKFHQSRKLMIELRTIKDVNHSNLCRFVGIVVDEGSLAIVSEFCPKGSLREFFHNESMVIDWTFKYSIINDIIAGLLYLHSSQLGYHGRLKSSNCLVSARFVVKLSDYGPHSLYDQIEAGDNSTEAGADDNQSDNNSDWYKKRIWLAPEHMKSSGSKMSGSMKGDIYSFGLLLYEIITNKLPFFNAEKEEFVMPLRSLYQELRARGPCPEIGPDMGAIELATANNTDDSGNEVNIEPLVELMQSCWRFEAAKRPSSMVVGTAIKKITRGMTSKKLLENLTSRMEQYTNNLESLVDAKLAALLEEKLKTEELLYQFVPRSIASMLKEGQTVEPEAFDCVTVFYSDIVGFTSLSSESSPMEVVDFLSDLYLCFDETLEQHDIFKVDTIGDAYIVASGLPKRNEGKHVLEIASAALELRDRLKEFKIPHKPNRALEMRVGIHSGPCIAGIVGGLNMPKYCVFGDTLTIGKFMESSGLPMKIHVTDESRRLLEGHPNFQIEPRTPKIAKDGLPFQTYWLERA